MTNVNGVCGRYIASEGNGCRVTSHSNKSERNVSSIIFTSRGRLKSWAVEQVGDLYVCLCFFIYIYIYTDQT